MLNERLQDGNGVAVLSLFDGMACGVLAFQKAGIPINRYVAYEIDKYAIQTSSYNFPFIEHMGDVFDADFVELCRGGRFDYLIGGSPCTYWSIAQKKNRETEASGLGWELFSQYLKALKVVQPKYFIYENNKSMSKQIRASIDRAFGFEGVEINSALVSAQNRRRLYWVGKRNENGIYQKVDVKQPIDQGIVLKDILETGFGNGAGIVSAEPLNITPQGKSQTIKAQYPKTSVANICCYSSTYGASGVAMKTNDPPTIYEGASKDNNAIQRSYMVKDGLITIKGKQYPVNLNDGCYKIRKLSVRECMRLQTVPECFQFPVSDSQAYKLLGNGWTIDIISHLINCTK